MTFYAFIQKTCIWALSLTPFVYVSITRMRGFGPEVTGASLLAIFHCMVVLGLCMYLAEQWCTLWNMLDAEDRPSVDDERRAINRRASAEAREIAKTGGPSYPSVDAMLASMKK